MMKLFVKYQLRKLVRIFAREKSFRQYDEIRKVLLFFDIEDLAGVETFVETLVRDGKQVVAYSFDPTKNAHPQLPQTIRIWKKQQLDFLGIPKPAEVAVFREQKADTIIDLTGPSSLIQQFLFLSASASYRIGTNRNNVDFYDVLVERNPEQEFSFFADQLLFYMKRLRTK